MNVEMNITTIREYQPTDKNAVIDLIRQNTPAYFAPKEEADFSNYLDSERELYFVLLLNKKVVGCGGINFTKDKASGKISWDIIHPQYQGKSLGAQLLKYRIEIDSFWLSFLFMTNVIVGMIFVNFFMIFVT